MELILDVVKIKVANSFKFIEELEYICDMNNIELEYGSLRKGSPENTIQFVFDSDTVKNNMYKDRFTSTLLSQERVGRELKQQEIGFIGKFDVAYLSLYVGDFEDVREALESLESTSQLRIVDVLSATLSKLSTGKTVSITAKGIAKA